MTGFGVVAKRPVVLIWWILLHLLFMGSITAAFVVFAGPALTQMMALQAQGTPTDPETRVQMLALFGQIFPLYAAIFPVMLAFYAILFGTMNRAVLRPVKSAFGYLRLSVDEWRQFLLYLWALVLGFAAYIAVVVLAVAVAIIGGLVFAAMHKGPVSTGETATATAIGAVVLGVLYIMAWIYVAVRLSLASPMTFDTGKVSLLKSWRLTKGQFWPMLGAYLLATILAMVVMLLGLIVILVCTMLAGGIGGLVFIFRPDMSSPAAYFSTPRLVYLALSGVLYALVWPILLTPSAAIYKALTAKPEAKPASWPSPPPLETPPAPDPFVEPPADPEHP